MSGDPCNPDYATLTGDGRSIVRETGTTAQIMLVLSSSHPVDAPIYPLPWHEHLMTRMLVRVHTALRKAHGVSAPSGLAVRRRERRELESAGIDWRKYEERFWFWPYGPDGIGRDRHGDVRGVRGVVEKKESIRGAAASQGGIAYSGSAQQRSDAAAASAGMEEGKEAKAAKEKKAYIPEIVRIMRYLNHTTANAPERVRADRLLWPPDPPKSVEYALFKTAEEQRRAE